MAKILLALPEHASQLTHITIAAKRYWGYPEAWMQQWIPALTISPEYISENETWLAIINDKPVAYYSLKQNGADLWLDNLWVLPDYMGQGIGRKLFQHVLEKSRLHGASTIKIEADPNAQSFYEKMGARKVDEYHSEVDGQMRVLPIMEINL